MITLHAFANMFPGGIGETKDIRIQWALEEMGLPYEVKPLDYLGGEADSPEFSAISPFNQIPVLEDDGLVIAESGAILLHLAEKSGRLIPADEAGRLRVIQWCFAAVATVQPVLSMIAMVDAGFMGKDPATRAFLAGLANRWLAGLERQLQGHDWIAGDDFTIADITLADVLREIRETDLMDGYPAVKAFYARAFARPARLRARRLTAGRMGVELDAIA
jgi:glutathione S-transferase